MCSPGRDERGFARRAAPELQPTFAVPQPSDLSSLPGLRWPSGVGPTAEAVGYFQPSLPGRRGGVLCPQSLHKTAWPSHLKFAQRAHKSRISSTKARKNPRSAEYVLARPIGLISTAFRCNVMFTHDNHREEGVSFVSTFLSFFPCLRASVVKIKSFERGWPALEQGTTQGRMHPWRWLLPRHRLESRARSGAPVA